MRKRTKPPRIHYRILMFCAVLFIVCVIWIGKMFACVPTPVDTVAVYHESAVQVEEVFPSPLVLQVSDIVFNNMSPTRSSSTQLTEEEALTIANEIIYNMEWRQIDVGEGLPYVLSIFYQESRFDPNAKNPYSTASGLGQLLRMHWHTNGVRWGACEQFDPVKNLYRAFDLIEAGYWRATDRGREGHSRWLYVAMYYTGDWTGSGISAGDVRWHNFFRDQLAQE